MGVKIYNSNWKNIVFIKNKFTELQYENIKRLLEKIDKEKVCIETNEKKIVINSVKDEELLKNIFQAKSNFAIYENTDESIKYGSKDIRDKKTSFYILVKPKKNHVTIIVDESLYPRTLFIKKIQSEYKQEFSFKGYIKRILIIMTIIAIILVIYNKSITHAISDYRFNFNLPMPDPIAEDYIKSFGGENATTLTRLLFQEEQMEEIINDLALQPVDEDLTNILSQEFNVYQTDQSTNSLIKKITIESNYYTYLTEKNEKILLILDKKANSIYEFIKYIN